MSDDSTPQSSQLGRQSATVGGGLLLLGASASAFLVFAARETGPEAFAGLAVLWTLVYTVGIGLFLPFEQELARAVSERVAQGEGPGPVIRRAAGAATGMFLVLTLVVGATLPWTHASLFDNSPAGVAGFSLGCAGLAAQYVQRGAFSGTGRFRAYAAQIAIEGGARLLGTAALVYCGITSAVPYALVLGLAPIASVLAVSPVFLPLVRGAGALAAWRELSTKLLWLLLSAVAAQALANLGTVAVRVLGRSLDPGIAGHFMSGLTVARIPLFAFGAVQAVLLPGLTRHLARAEHRSFRRQLATVLLATGALGLAGVVGAGLLGPAVLRLLFGASFSLRPSDLVWLAASTAVYMLALVFQPAVIALREHRANAVAWSAGLAAFLAGLAVPGDILRRVEIALTVGGTVTMCLLCWRTVTSAAEIADSDAQFDPAMARVGME